MPRGRFSHKNTTTTTQSLNRTKRYQDSNTSCFPRPRHHNHPLYSWDGNDHHHSSTLVIKQGGQHHHMCTLPIYFMLRDITRVRISTGGLLSPSLPRTSSHRSNNGIVEDSQRQRVFIFVVLREFSCVFKVTQLLVLPIRFGAMRKQAISV